MANGRPTSLTDELAEKFYGVIRDGGSVEQACDICYISPSTFYLWKQKAEAGDPSYAKFSEGYKAISAQYTLECVKGIRTTQTGWQALAWLAERKRREWRMPKEEPVVAEPIPQAVADELAAPHEDK